MLPRNLRRLVLCLHAGLLASAGSLSQAAEPELTRTEALVVLDYQTIKVPNDAPLDLMGLHLHQKVLDHLYVGVGVYAPLVRGEYGGFMAFDVGLHGRWHLSQRVFATAGLAGGGGGGGRSTQQSAVLSGTGGFVKTHIGLGYEFADLSVGVNLAHLKFKDSAINDAGLNLFVQIPFSYVSAGYTRHGEPAPAGQGRPSGEEATENMLSLTLDNFQQIDPQGLYKGSIRAADLQYSRFFGPDTYWFAELGVGYAGRPLYNQFLGGLGQRVWLTQKWRLYGQLGIGSGGYAPETIDTGPGLLLYPKLSAEYALTRTLGLALSAGYLVAPEGSSKNTTFGLALNYHLGGTGNGTRSLAASFIDDQHYRGFRLSLAQQTQRNVRYDNIDRGDLQMIAAQVDTPLTDRWYLALQAGVAYNAYLGFPGYGEMLAGLGVESKLAPGDRWQVYGQALGGTNVHGLAVKGAAGVRWMLSERWSVNLNAGRTQARRSSGERFSADSIGLGLDYRFAVPGGLKPAA